MYSKKFISILFLIFIFIIYCNKQPILLKNSLGFVIPLEDFQKLNWLEKIQYLEKNSISLEILNASLRDKKDHVVIAALKKNNKKIEDFEPLYANLLLHKNPIIRLYTYEYFFTNSDFENLNIPLFQKALKDKDWIIKEKTIREVRLYPYEKINKKLYYSLIVMLKYQEPNIVREAYKTLLWYQDTNLIPILYRRAYNVKSALECSIILEILQKYPKVKDSIIEDIIIKNEKICNL